MTESTVTRAQLAEAVYQEVGLSRNDSAQLVDVILEEREDRQS
jgi:integration host factor subunit alpha